MDFDGSRIVYKKIESNGHKTIGLIDLNIGNLNEDKRLISKGKQHQTLCHADDLGINWILARNRKEYWGFQLNDENTDRIAYISNQNIIKIYSISKSDVELRLSGHKAGYVLAFQHQRDYLISLGTDRTVRIWFIAKVAPKRKNKKNKKKKSKNKQKNRNKNSKSSRDESKTNENNGNDSSASDDDYDGDEINEQLDNLRRRHFGRCIFVKENIVGSFVPGYIYKVIMINGMIFYSCDNGIFGFNVNLPEWCMY